MHYNLALDFAISHSHAFPCKPTVSISDDIKRVAEVYMWSMISEQGLPF